MYRQISTLFYLLHPPCISSAGMAWSIIPRQSLVVNFFFLGPLTSWRVFVLVCVLPAFSAALLLLFFPESPKFLIKSGRGPEAKAVFLRILRLNDGVAKSAGRNLYEFHSSLFADTKGWFVSIFHYYIHFRCVINMKID